MITLMISFLDTIALSDTKTVKQKNGNKMMECNTHKKECYYISNIIYTLWLLGFFMLL